MKKIFLSISLQRLKIIMFALSFVTLLFPPWGNDITRNGVSVMWSGGHHFIGSRPELMDIDYKKLGIYLLIIWVAYFMIKFIRIEFTKE